MNDNEKVSDQHELDVIRMKKMKALMEAQKRTQAAQERSHSVYEKVDYVLKAVLTPEAYTYFNNLKSKEPAVYQQIFNELISPDVIQELDYLIAVISQQTIPNRIPLDVIIMIERKVKGIKSKIHVKRGDETLDLGSYLTK